MKQVVSVSLGSSARNHRVVVNVLGQDVAVERIGTDGSLQKVIQQIRKLDGKVDALGLGGIDRYIYVGEKRYTFREAEVIAKQARQTPILDGSGLKHALERHVVRQLADHPLIALRGKKVLLVAAADRFGMATSLVEIGCEVTCGDLMFGFGVPVPIRSLKGLERWSRVIVPMITKLPIRFLHQAEEQQREIRARFAPYYERADVIAGDFWVIRKHLPNRLTGKIILTTTVTAADVALLQERGVHALVTTMPNMGGRSYDTNVMEALLVALTEERGELPAETYLQVLEEIGFEPRVSFF
jgi:hypothetical protein